MRPHGQQDNQIQKTNTTEEVKSPNMDAIKQDILARRKRKAADEMEEEDVDMKIDS